MLHTSDRTTRAPVTVSKKRVLGVDEVVGTFLREARAKLLLLSSVVFVSFLLCVQERSLRPTTKKKLAQLNLGRTTRTRAGAEPPSYGKQKYLAHLKLCRTTCMRTGAAPSSYSKQNILHI